MSIIFTSPDLTHQIIYQAHPSVIVELAKTNKFFREQLGFPGLLKKLGEIFGWYLQTFDDFIDAYYTTHVTPMIHEWMGYKMSMSMAFRCEAVEIADQLFEFIRFHDGVNNSFMYRMEAEAIFAGEATYSWYLKKVLPYGAGQPCYPGLEAAAKLGDIEKFNSLLNGVHSLVGASWVKLLSKAYASGRPEMVDRIFFGLPMYNFSTWKGNDGKIKFTNDVSNIGQNMWDIVMGGAISSGKISMINRVKETASNYGITFENVSYEMAIGAAQSRDVSLIKQYVIEYILEENEDDEDDKALFVNMIVQTILSGCHPNNLDIIKMILGVLPNTTHMIFRGLFRAIIDSGNLNVLRYVTDFYSVTPKSLDVIYQHVINSYHDFHISGTGIPTSYHEDDIEASAIKVGVPVNPGVLKWFRKYGDDLRIYRIPVSAETIDDVILSYRIEPLKVWLLEAIVRKQDEYLIIKLLRDYRIARADFDTEEMRIINTAIHNAKTCELKTGNIDNSEHPLVMIHRMYHLSYEERYRLMVNEARKPTIIESPIYHNSSRRIASKIMNVYLTSDDLLANTLNALKVPFIPCFDHLAASILLSMDGPQLSDDLEMILPTGIYQYANSALHYMKEKRTYSELIREKKIYH